MRVNVYAEEMSDRIEIVTKETPEGKFTGLRFYLYLPVTQGDRDVSGPFIHREGDDDSAAVTFWGKTALRRALTKALALLDDQLSTESLTCANCGEVSTNPGNFVKDGRWVCTEVCRKKLCENQPYDDLAASGGIVDAP